MHQPVLNRVQGDGYDSQVAGCDGLDMPETSKIRVGGRSRERERDVAVNCWIIVQVDALECDLVETGLPNVRQFMESLNAREGKLVN